MRVMALIIRRRLRHRQLKPGASKMGLACFDRVALLSRSLDSLDELPERVETMEKRCVCHAWWNHDPATNIWSCPDVDAEKKIMYCTDMQYYHTSKTSRHQKKFALVRPPRASIVIRRVYFCWV